MWHRELKEMIPTFYSCACKFLGWGINYSTAQTSQLSSEGFAPWIFLGSNLKMLSQFLFFFMVSYFYDNDARLIVNIYIFL